MRNCESCGVEFEPKRSNQKFHSSACRGRARYVPKSTKPKRPVNVEAATLRALEQAGVVDTPLGQAALILAARLDVAGESGSTLAQLADKLRTTIEAATKSQGASGDPMDELAERRRRRLAGV